MTAYTLTIVKFKYEGSNYQGSIDNVDKFLQALSLTIDKAALVFKDVIITHSVQTFNHDHHLYLWHDKGPYSAEEILKMLKFDRTLTLKDWSNWIYQFNKTKTEHVNL